MSEQERAFLADEPGLGKSRQLLLAARGRTLVVAPAMVLDGGVWDDEIAKWTPNLDVQTVPYTSITQREKTGNGKGTRPTDRLRPEYAGHWDTVILDEAHYVKGRKTTWTKAVQRLQADRMYLASGTPIPNYAPELFVPLQLLHPDQARKGYELGSYWRWAKRWFNVDEGHHGGLKVGGLNRCTPMCKLLRWPEVCDHWRAFHDESFQGRFLQRLRDDVLTDLPPMTEQTIECTMGAAQKRAYTELKRDFITWLDSGTQVTAWNSAAQTVKLAKAATGLEVLGSTVTGSAKLDVLRSILVDRAQPTLIVAHFQDSCQAAADVAASLGLRVAPIVDGRLGSKQRRVAVQGFQAGNYDVLVGSFETVAEGLTLTRADCVVFLEHSWKPSRNVQALRRIHRIGQDRPVTALHLVTKGTIDERILRVVATKTDQQMKALRPHDLRQLV